jgi:hypothetical protein
MLFKRELPELAPDLVAALAHLDRDQFARHWECRDIAKCALGAMA